VKNKSQVIDQLKLTPIVQIACQKAGISRATYYRWRDEDESFRNISDHALTDGIGFINDLAESQLISLIKEKVPTSIYYWLNHNHPRYSDRRIYLTDSEQKTFLNAVKSSSQEAYEELTKNATQGKIPRTFINSIIQLINRITKSKTEEENQKKIDLLSKINKL